jgi:hypothetical protein
MINFSVSGLISVTEIRMHISKDIIIINIIEEAWCPSKLYGLEEWGLISGKDIGNCFLVMLGFSVLHWTRLIKFIFSRYGGRKASFWDVVVSESECSVARS